MRKSKIIKLYTLIGAIVFSSIMIYFTFNALYPVLLGVSLFLLLMLLDSFRYSGGLYSVGDTVMITNGIDKHGLKMGSTYMVMLVKDDGGLILDVGNGSERPVNPENVIFFKIN